MAGSESIPEFVRKQVEEIVERFNAEEIADTGKVYNVRFSGRYAYIDRDDGTGPCPVLRLAYTGDIAGWEFAIYKYSADDYDEEEVFFPGAEKVDGTVEGALRAGMKAYG